MIIGSLHIKIENKLKREGCLKNILRMRVKIVALIRNTRKNKIRKKDYSFLPHVHCDLGFLQCAHVPCSPALHDSHLPCGPQVHCLFLSMILSLKKHSFT